MNRYEPSTPRAALGLTAVGMAAVTLAALVVLPAELETVNAATSLQAAARADDNGPHRSTSVVEPSMAGLTRLKCAFFKENS